MKALALTLLESLAALALLALLVDHGPAIVALFAVVLVVREVAERERTRHLLDKQAAEWNETKRRLYLEVRRHES